jgi:hypothetical protein
MPQRIKSLVTPECADDLLRSGGYIYINLTTYIYSLVTHSPHALTTSSSNI